MLDTLMQIGSYRVSYFENYSKPNPLEFGFYIRGEKTGLDEYSHEAKQQLYAGLLLIQSRMQMRNLRGIYVDVDSIDNLERPAYLQLKKDLINGLFHRIFILEESALLGTRNAEIDLCYLYNLTGGFELIVCQDGECVAVKLPWLK